MCRRIAAGVGETSAAKALEKRFSKMEGERTVPSTYVFIQRFHEDGGVNMVQSIATFVTCATSANTTGLIRVLIVRGHEYPAGEIEHQARKATFRVIFAVSSPVHLHTRDCGDLPDKFLRHAPFALVVIAVRWTVWDTSTSEHTDWLLLGEYRHVEGQLHIGHEARCQALNVIQRRLEHLRRCVPSFEEATRVQHVDRASNTPSTNKASLIPSASIILAVPIKEIPERP
mmetsp:Transcript_61386/g.116038  ORF Transcript_61386/g.116038 Transcript_61386/m.116038 type:complete len:229 (+) Transcript_61386:673-1359(+)